MDLHTIIRKAIEIGDQAGFVTFDQINELLPSDLARPEDIETLFEALSARGINVTET
ncbi:MAG: RNA polymerase sigma factor region1.1 domain-containing protein [Bradyrhizobium sp.]|nr:RNA polymerase sigma factor region1.1 domain-containing protein [Bradyrhizobium sp.]